MQITNVLIGIQARSTSTRLPGKCFAMIGEKRLLDHVIDSAKSAAAYMNRYTDKSGVLVKVALLIPFEDSIGREFKRRCSIVHGPENDVLERYVKAAQEFESDYIVRVTGDCPMIPPYLISKHIKFAVINHYDFVCNCHAEMRTSLDGVDCEVMSKNMIEYLSDNAKPGQDREHVTLMAKREPPSWAKIGFVGGFFDQSGIKLSVDTQDDLDRVRREYESLNSRMSEAEKRYGKQFVHRI